MMSSYTLTFLQYARDTQNLPLWSYVCLDGLIPTRDYSCISTYYENHIKNKAQNPANTSITLVGVCMLGGKHKAPAEILYLDGSLFSEIYTWQRARHFEK